MGKYFNLSREVKLLVIILGALFLVLGIYLGVTRWKDQHRYHPLRQSPSNITITRYQGWYKRAESAILTGTALNTLYTKLDEAGKRIIPKETVLSCPSGSNGEQSAWLYDIIVHYAGDSSSDRLFELDAGGCATLFDAKDDLILNPAGNLDLDAYFISH